MLPRIGDLEIKRMTGCTRVDGLIHALRMPPETVTLLKRRNPPARTLCGAPAGDSDSIVLRFAPINPALRSIYTTVNGEEITGGEPCPECFPRDVFVGHLRGETLPDSTTGNLGLIMSALRTLGEIRAMDPELYKRCLAWLIPMMPEKGEMNRNAL